MTSVQTKKGGKGTTERERQTILKEMKVRTKLKTDMSWINQGSEDDKDEVTSPISPQLKALEGRKLLWSPTPESESNRNSGIFTAKEITTSPPSPTVQSSNKNSGIFTAKEIITSSSSPPVQSSNNRFSYTSNETNTTPSISSKTSPPPSTTGNKPTTSYIIRGQTLNSVSQVKSPTFFNGYQKSQVQARTTSLPRVPTATGYKMSTDEYKKLAPYNVRNKSPDLSDDETQFTQQEQVKRTEQASSVLRNTTTKDRSYVISAAKRNSGVVTHDSPSPFVAKRVEIQDEETGTNRKSQTLPKTLSSFLADDANRYENKWTETQPKQTPPQPSQPRVTERSSSPRMTSYSMTSSADGRSSPLKPETGKITVVRDESRNENKDVSKPPTEKESSTTVQTIRTQRYENNWTETQPKQTPPQPSQPRVTERSSSPRMTSYSMTSSADGRSSPLKPETGKITVVRDESRNESKDVSKPPTEKESSTTVQTTRTQRVTERSSSPRLTSYSMSSSIDGRSSPVKPEAGRVTVVRDGGVEVKDKKDGSLPKSLESYLYEDASRFENNWKTNPSVQPALQTSPARVEVKDKKDESPPKSLDSYLYEDASRFENKWKTNQTIQPTSQTSPARVSDRPESPKLSSWNTQTKTSTINPEPGKITVLRQESEKTTPKPTENRATTRTVTTTVESGNINPDMPKLTSYSDITETKSSSIQAGPGKITVLREESPDSNKEPPKVTTQVTTTTRTVDPKVESNKDSPDIPKLTSSSISRTLTENPTPIMQVGPGKITIIREDSTHPKPVPRTETKLKDTSSDKKSDLISWTDLDNRSDNRFPKEKPATAPTPVARNINKASEKPANEAPLIVISPEFDEKRPAQPSRTESISTETRYRVSESLDDSQPIPSSNRITSTSGDRNVKITIETLSEQPQSTETTQTERSSSPRPSPRSRESTTTFTETRYRVPESLQDTMLESSPSRSNSHTTVSTTRSTNPVYTEYLEDSDSRSRRTVSSSMEKITTTTTVESRYDNASSGDTSQYDPQSSSNKGILFVKEYVNTSENLKSPTTTGSLPDFSGDSEMLSYNTSSSYLYSSPPRRSEEGPCTYCGREIKDCAKIMLDHLNIYCHEYCFKCGICHKPMGDLIDSIFIHRDVVHCESCYEKLF